MPPLLPPLPLLHEGDSYVIYLKSVGEKCVRIVTIHRFANNQNVEGVEEDFRDLDLETKKAVIKQINRRHVGKTVLI